MSEEQFCIRIADVNIGIRPRYKAIRRYCSNYVVDEEPELVIEMSDTDLEKERKLVVDLPGFSNISDSELEKYCFHRLIAEKLAEYDTALIHAVAVAVDGQGYLFTGPSGAGKTTHSRLWKKTFEDRMLIINDDKPMVRVLEDEIRIYGSPWCGKERLNHNTSAPLCGIACIRQASENRISRLSDSRAWETLLNQIYRGSRASATKKILPIMDRIIRTVPVYLLECNTQQEAAQLAYDTITGRRAPGGEIK